MLHNSGIGTERKRAEVITAEIEAQMWAGVLGFHSPQAFLNTMFFYNGKNFCLRGVHEHFNLQFSQIHHTTYTEFGSKYHSGESLIIVRVKKGSIVATGTPNCHVEILDIYLVNEEGKFYLSTLPFTPTGTKPCHGFTALYLTLLPSTVALLQST